MPPTRRKFSATSSSNQSSPLQFAAYDFHEGGDEQNEQRQFEEHKRKHVERELRHFLQQMQNLGSSACKIAEPGSSQKAKIVKFLWNREEKRRNQQIHGLQHIAGPRREDFPQISPEIFVRHFPIQMFQANLGNPFFAQPKYFERPAQCQATHVEKARFRRWSPALLLLNIDESAEEARRALQPPSRELSVLLKYMEDRLALSPLNTIARACLDLEIRDETALNIFGSYDKFLAVLDDKDKRDELARAHSHEDLRTSDAWKEVREVTKPFHQGLVNLFLNDDDRLKDLTMEYGLF